MHAWGEYRKSANRHDAPIISKILFMLAPPYESVSMNTRLNFAVWRKTAKRYKKRPASEPASFCPIRMSALYRALYKAGTHTTCADVFSFGRTIFDYTDSLYVGSPLSLGFSMRVRYAVARRNALAANFTILGHTYTSLGVYRSNHYILALYIVFCNRKFTYYLKKIEY